MTDILVMLAIVAAVGVAYFLKAQLQKASRPPVVHTVTIIAARREEDDSRYYYAGCDCGWVGENTDTEEEARAEGRTHAPDVRPEVESLDVSASDEADDTADPIEEARWRRRRIASGIFLWSQLGGAIIGILFSNVSPSALAIRAGLVGSVALAACWVVFMERQWGRVGGWSNNPLMRSRWGRVPIAFIVGFWLAYVTLVWTVPWAVNKGFGTPGKEWFVVKGWNFGSRLGCSGPRAHGSFVDAPHAFCAPSSERTMYPTGVNFFIEGPATVLGINTERRSVPRRFP